MTSTLRKFGVEPQAIEQPPDLSIPKNKMMLASYLEAPEVENDRDPGVPSVKGQVGRSLKTTCNSDHRFDLP